MDESSVVKAVTDVFGITEEELKGKSNKRKYVYARTVTAIFLRSAGFSLRETGNAVGRDHSTICRYEGVSFQTLQCQYSDFMDIYTKIDNILRNGEI